MRRMVPVMAWSQQWAHLEVKLDAMGAAGGDDNGHGMEPAMGTLGGGDASNEAPAKEPKDMAPVINLACM